MSSMAEGSKLKPLIHRRMLARHPITGNQIRILQTDASIWKERKTLVWNPTEKESLVYDTIQYGGNIPATYYLILENVKGSTLQEYSKRCKLLFISKKIVENIPEFRSLGIQNIMCLEELHGLYRQLGEEWDGSEEDALTMIVGLMNYKVTKNIPLTARGVEWDVEQTVAKPHELWWITQYYTPAKAKRRREITKCLEENIQSPLISKIVLLNEKKEQLPVSSKIVEKVIGHRLRYKDVFEYIQKENIPDNVIVAFANADICIDNKSWKDIWNIQLEERCLALLRWDVPPEGVQRANIFGPRADSQDTWILLAKDVKKRPSLLQGTDFQFGRMGCDNAIAMELLKNKFVVVNPALSLKTWHYHSSEIRGYNPQDVVEKPMFHYVQPTGIHDLEADMKWYGVMKKESLTIDIQGPGAEEWCKRMNSRLGDKERQWCVGENTFVENIYEPQIEYNCFELPEGVAFTNKKLCIGPGVEAQKFWGKVHIQAIAPTIEVERAVIVPYENEFYRYVLYYLSRVLQSTGYFFCPEKKENLETLSLFKWSTPNPPILRPDPRLLTYCKTGILHNVRNTSFIMPRDIEALRKNLVQYKETIEGQKIVLMGDFDETIEDLLKKKYEVQVIYQETSLERIQSALSGACGIVVRGDNPREWMWNWLLPKGAFVYHIDGNSLESLVLSSASGLNHRFVSEENYLQEILQEEIQLEDNNLPIVYLPRRGLEGFFAHAGDSFREMAREWAKRGYCRVKEHATATQCWWGDVGKKGILLYDRPNHDWRLACPENEKSYEFALFGNPKPVEGGSAWFFWPRRPSYVEELVEEGIGGWSSRNPGVVYYGKIENRVQEKRRTTMPWKEACKDGEWVCVRGAEPYPFTQREYLEKLRTSRFGLCLAGYGYKCHREVECMAMGCVPLIAPECDMDSYANPPQEGVHYIRVKNPEEALEVSRNMSEERWNDMSIACKKWWKENCSVEGSFELTRKLIEEKKSNK